MSQISRPDPTPLHKLPERWRDTSEILGDRYVGAAYGVCADELEAALAAQAPADADPLAEVQRLRDALESIRDYWNRDRNDEAMHDPCWYAVNTAADALEPQAAVRAQSPASPAEAATLPPDLLRAALLALESRQSIELAASSHGTQAEWNAALARVTRTREALARLFPEEAKADATRPS